jgi:ankyrin repeat protein
MVEALLAGNASPLQKALDGSDAYQSAVNAGRQLVALLIAEASAVHAIESDNTEALVTALTRGAYSNIRNGAGWTPMIYAVAKGDMQLISTILKYGPDLNRTENDGWTALHFAASTGNVEAAKTLLSKNADAFARNVEGKTARDIAIQENHQEVADILPVHEGL